MRTGIVCMAALLALAAGVAEAQGEKGRWHPVQNIAGCTVWNPGPQPGETATWSGSCAAGKAEGQGTLVWRYRKDGKAKEERTTGTLAAGKFVGDSVHVNSDGDRFEGDVNGRGVISFANGDRYEGDFRDFRRTGRGVYTWPNGNRYEGEFRDGKRNGRGVFTWASGNRYEGEYRDDKRTGRGTFTFEDGSRYVGEFRDGDFTGYGVLTWRDGTRFEGRFLDNIPVGAGTCTKDGRTGRCLIENNQIRWLD